MQGFGSNSERPQPQPVRASQGLIAPEAFSALSCSMMRVDLKILSRFSDANSLQQSSSELPIEEIVPIEEIAWCKTLNCSCESCKDQQAPVQRFCAPRSLPFKTLINSVATKAPMSIGPRSFRHFVRKNDHQAPKNRTKYNRTFNIGLVSPSYQEQRQGELDKHYL